MAVVQISRIQIRRGKSQGGTGFPQLASGEMGWAIDTQELYIGNGAVAEGSPAVGNTKILTDKDITAQGNLLKLLQHIYKVNDTSIVTGPSPNDPISRAIQDRLDDRVTSTDFGVLGEAGGSSDDTVTLQRAIDQLFLNTTKASTDTSDGVKNRITLELPAGNFNITDSIYIPSYATIIGAGSDKTVIKFTGTTTAFKFINDTSTIGNPSTIDSSLYINQPRFIKLKGLTLQSQTSDQIGFKLDAVRDSVFEDIKIVGFWEGMFDESSIGVELNSFAGESTVVTCERNLFKQVTIEGFSYAVLSKHDIRNNTFEDCLITDVKFGFSLGEVNYPGVTYGPRDTLINNCWFENVKQTAVFVGFGTGNAVENCKMVKVGCDGGSMAQSAYSQIYFGNHGNFVKNLTSDRTDLINGLAGQAYLDVPYYPEVSGYGTYTTPTTLQISVGQQTGYTDGFRLPLSVNEFNMPSQSISYTIDYVYRSFSNNYSRRGKLRILADVSSTIDTQTAIVNLSDEYDVIGIAESDAVKFDFRIRLLNQSGEVYSALDVVPYTISVQYTNNIGNDQGFFTYSYTSIFGNSL